MRDWGGCGTGARRRGRSGAARAMALPQDYLNGWGAGARRAAILRVLRSRLLRDVRSRWLALLRMAPQLRPGALALLALLVPCASADAQGRRVQVSGSLTASTDFYSQTGRRYDVRPGALAGLQGQVNVALPGGITLPFSAFVSTEGGAGYQQPFNQLGASPAWRWGRAHGGYFSTRLTDLTLADARLLGAGLELTPGPVRVGAVYGRAQRAVAADSLRGRLPLFERRLGAVQLGLGREGGWHLWLTGLRAADAPGSLALLPSAIRPEENLVVSAAFGGRAGRYVRLRGEVAGSAWTTNALSDTLSLDDPDLQRWLDRLAPLVRVNASTRLDYAATASLDVAPVQAFSVGLQGRFVGPGFKSLGAQQTEADVLDVLVAPTLRLRRVQAGVRVGLRQNNVAGTRLETRTRALYAANVAARLTDALSLTLDASNYGLRTSQEVDTLRVASVARSFSVAPAYTLRRGRTSHSLSGAYAYQDLVDQNRTSGQETATRNHTVTATHVWALPAGLSLTTNATVVRGLTRDVETTLLSVSETVQHRLRGGKVSLGGGLAFTQSTVPGTPAAPGAPVAEQNDRGLNARLRATYRLNRQSTLEASANGRVFRYGAPRAGQDGLREGMARVAYTYSF